ncbi:hypothetical protein IX84_16150 [Phaeodactylibacter xiamenensis]|uniref:Uncharacterized protein n=1 Tax=Phaeodactylibacter xiamenensis TaxID=1524460 RepID=A0A098S5V5_9BACT|nr:hypothetical protein IX84_16150 [Phaeodactylibacter xiamenensis]
MRLVLNGGLTKVEVEVEVEGLGLVSLGATACCRFRRRNPEGLILSLPWARPRANLSLSLGGGRLRLVCNGGLTEVEVEGRSLVFLGATACCRFRRRNPEGLILSLPWALRWVNLSLCLGGGRLRLVCNGGLTEVEVEGRSLVSLGATACCRFRRRTTEGLILSLPWARPRANLSLCLGGGRLRLVCNGGLTEVEVEGRSLVSLGATACCRFRRRNPEGLILILTLGAALGQP